MKAIRIATLPVAIALLTGAAMAQNKGASTSAPGKNQAGVPGNARILAPGQQQQTGGTLNPGSAKTFAPGDAVRNTGRGNR